MRIEVTYAQRLGLALMFQANWNAPEDVLYLFEDIFESFGLQEVTNIHIIQGEKGTSLRELGRLYNSPAISVEVRKEVAEYLLATYPQVPTPALLGPAKVALIRALRSGVTAAVLPEQNPSEV